MKTKELHKFLYYFGLRTEDMKREIEDLRHSVGEISFNYSHLNLRKKILFHEARIRFINGGKYPFELMRTL